MRSESADAQPLFLSSFLRGWCARALSGPFWRRLGAQSDRAGQPRPPRRRLLPALERVALLLRRGAPNQPGWPGGSRNTSPSSRAASSARRTGPDAALGPLGQGGGRRPGRSRRRHGRRAARAARRGSAGPGGRPGGRADVAAPGGERGDHGRTSLRDAKPGRTAASCCLLRAWPWKRIRPASPRVKIFLTLVPKRSW
jgi:hypothetical protein